VEWNMDSSDNNKFVASGHISKTLEDSIDFLEKLSVILEKYDIKHEILMDYENGNKTFKIEK